MSELCCQEGVYQRPDGDTRCNRPAKRVRDGKPYCGLHDPANRRRPRTAKPKLAEVYAALFEVYNLCAVMKFEPDPGKPHPLKDGMYDKIMNKAAVLLQDYEPPSAPRSDP